MARVESVSEWGCVLRDCACAGACVRADMPRRASAANTHKIPNGKRKFYARNAIVAMMVGASMNGHGNDHASALVDKLVPLLQGREEPIMETVTVYSLKCLFLKGKLNLNPLGQRGRVYTVNFVRNLSRCLMNKIRPPSILVNVLGSEGTWDVHDGKQRLSAIIDVLIGMRSMLMRDEDGNTVEAFMVNPESDYGYLGLLNSSKTPDVVKNYITESLQHMVADEFDVENSFVFESDEVSCFSSATLIVQRLAGWSSVAATCLALIQASGSIQQTVGEIFYMTPNALTLAVRQFENRAVEMILAMCRSTLHNNDKQIFMAILTGAACTLDIAFVPKTSSDEGKGEFFKATIPFIEQPTPDDFNRNLEAVCTERLPAIRQLMSSNEVMGTPLGKKPWKIDMVCVLIYLLMKKVSYLRVLSILNMLVLPGKSVDGKAWFDRHWRGKKDMKKALDELFAVLSAADDEEDDDDDDAEISEEEDDEEEEEEGAANARALRAACRSRAASKTPRAKVHTSLTLNSSSDTETDS